MRLSSMQWGNSKGDRKEHGRIDYSLEKWWYLGSCGIKPQQPGLARLLDRSAGLWSITIT